MTFQSVFMDVLRERFIETNVECEFGGTTSVSQAPYYVLNLDDNLVQPMSAEHISEYSQGNGNELETKMKSIRSSSAMTFNLLGNENLYIQDQDILPRGEYIISYEFQLPTLANNPNPANLDAALISADGKTEIYCEMKMAEWILGKASGLRNAYLDASAYFIPERAAAVFALIFDSLCSGKISSDGRFEPKLFRYDAFQMLKHALAIYSNCYLRKNSDAILPESILLINCVWEMLNPEKLGKYANGYMSRLYEEHEQFEAFLKYASSITPLFSRLGIDFHIEYIAFADLMRCIDIEDSRKSKLGRYLI